jgi:hypothetical protein
MQIRIKGNIAVSDSGFVFDSSTGDSFSINPIGVEIIRLMKESKDQSEIIKILTKQYDTEPKTIEKDLYDFVNLLLNHQLADKL